VNDRTETFAVGDFTAMVECHHHALFAFLVTLVRNRETAHDIMQDVFCDAWRAAQNSKPPFTRSRQDDDRRRWLYRVAYRQAISFHRHDRLIQWEPLELHDISHTDAFEESVVVRDAVRQALSQFEPRDVACLILHLVHEFSAREIADITGELVPAVSKRLIRTKQKLLKTYSAQELFGARGAQNER